MSSFSTGYNGVNLGRRANIRRVNRVSNAGRAVICPHPFASVSMYRDDEKKKKDEHTVATEEDTLIVIFRDTI